MRDGMKKSFVLFLVFLLIALLTMGIACGKGADEKDSSGQASANIELNYRDAALKVMERLQLAVVSGPDGAAEWTSDDPTIAKTDGNGLVEGISEGVTYIRVTIDGSSAVCEIVVLKSDMIPSIGFNGFDRIELLQSGTYKIEPFINYGGTHYSDGEFTFISQDETVATVSAEGVVTGVSVGTTCLEIKASWRSYANNIYLCTLLPIEIK